MTVFSSLGAVLQGDFCIHLQRVCPTPKMLARSLLNIALSTTPRTGLPSAMPIANHLSAHGHNLGVKESLQVYELFSPTSLLKTKSTNQ